MISINNNVTNFTISTNGSSSSTIGWFEQAVGYISLLNLIFGVIANVICFSVFVFTPELRNMSFVVYLTYCSLANILSLFEWNLNHYLNPMFGIRLEDLSLVSCRIIIFLQYFSLQISAYFLTWMSIDRFVSVIAMPGSLASRLPFSTAKTAHFWSLLTIVIIFGLNSHILILNGYYNQPKWLNMTLSNGTTITYLYQKPGYNCGKYSSTFNLWPLWDIVHVYVYTILPFTVMMLFNVLLAIGLAFYFNRGTTKRLNVLLDNTKRLALEQPLSPPLIGRDEIARLDHTFRDMASALEESRRKEHAVVDNAEDVICSFDRQGRFVVNRDHVEFSEHHVHFFQRFVHQALTSHKPDSDRG